MCEQFYLLRKQNDAFAPAHPICRKAHAGKVKGRAYKKVCPEKARPEENLRGQRHSRVPVGLSSNHGNFFHQLERNFVKKEDYMGLFGKIIGALKKTKDNISSKLSALFAKGLGDDFYDELEEILISADISVTTAEDIVEQIREEANKEKLKDREYAIDRLKDAIADTLLQAEQPKIEYPAVIMLVGVNGVGKTTTIGKLANYFVREKKSVTLAAADTFRAAAADQLTVWAERAKVRIVKHEEGSDPSAVVYDAIASAKAKKTDVVIVDTAGRLHVKANLMEELKKMDRVVGRDYPEAHFYKFLVLDATTGQNALSQARIFDEAVDLDGIVLTKLDGTAKGGFVVSLCGELQIPVVFVGTGEKLDDLQPFDAEEFTEGIL